MAAASIVNEDGGWKKVESRKSVSSKRYHGNVSSPPVYNNNVGDDLDEGWQRVKGRKGNRSEESFVESNRSDDLKNHKSKVTIVDRMSMTIFITNFPFRISNKEIWDRCSVWGTVVDVFIAKRRSKAGKPFGFVRFIKVVNAEKLLNGLCSIWFDNLRLFADIEKYPRKNSHQPLKSKGATDKADNACNQPLIWKAKDRELKSYAEVLSGVKGNTSSCPTKRRTVRIYTNESESVTKFSHDLLLKINEPHNIPYVRQWFHAEGFVDIEINYVGGRWIYVNFISHEAKDLFLSNKSLKHRFCSVKTPCDNFVPDERMVWVEISGLPKGVWFESNFQVLLGSWGKCIFMPSNWGEAYSMGKVCVLTQSINYIFEELNAVLDDKTYDIWIREFAVWEPDILQISHPIMSSDSGLDLEDSLEGNSESDDTPARSVSFDSEICKDHSDNECGNDVMEDNAIQNSSIPESVEELPSLDKNSVKKEQETNYHNGLDDHDIFLLNRLLQQDKCQVRPVKAVVNENFKVSSETFNEVTDNENHNQVANQNGDQPSSSVMSPSTPLATDISLDVESCSTWLDYIGPPADDKLDSEKIWSYKDPDENVQGPFSLAQLNMWKDYFSNDFRIWRYYGNVKDTVLLHSVLKRRKKDVG